jgi:hypothetical protein
VKLRSKLASILLAGTLAATAVVAVQGSVQAKAPELKPNKPAAVSGVQAKPDIEAGSMDKVSPATQPLGPTKLMTLDSSGKLATESSVAPAIGYDSSIDFSTVYNYCQGGLVYTTVRNYSAITKYFQVILSANGGTRTFYTSVAAGGTAYPTWYGVTGTYYAYLYVWNGTSYAYDEYKTSTNTCSVSVTWSTPVSGYVLMTAKNNGTAYASLESNELAPFPGVGTYTGRHWDYPAAGGGTIYRYYYVSSGLRYGIYANLYGALGYSPWYRYGP